MSVRVIPSWNLSLPEVLRPGGRIQLFRRHWAQTSWLATVEEVAPARVQLRLDPAELAQAQLEPDMEVVLGFGVAEPAMLFASDVVIEEVHPDRLIVSYPSPPRKRPRRAYARVALAWPCTLGTVGEADGPSETINLSASGALVRWPAERARPTVGQELRIELAPPGRDPLRLRARVVRCSPEVTGEAGMLAMCFLEVSEVDEMKLQLFVLRGIARRYVRVNVARPCRLTVDAGQGATVLTGSTENVSGSGMLLRLAAASPMPPLAPGDRVAIEVSLEQVPVVLSEARLTRVRPEGAELLVALDYSTAAPAVRSLIIEFVMGALGRV